MVWRPARWGLRSSPSTPWNSFLSDGPGWRPKVGSGKERQMRQQTWEFMTNFDYMSSPCGLFICKCTYICNHMHTYIQHILVLGGCDQLCWLCLQQIWFSCGKSPVLYHQISSWVEVGALPTHEWSFWVESLANLGHQWDWTKAIYIYLSISILSYLI
jgi:hypothetical protein